MNNRMESLSDGEREVFDRLVALQMARNDESEDGRREYARLHEEFEEWRRANPDRAADFERAKAAFEEHIVFERTEIGHGSALVRESHLAKASFNQRHPLTCGAMAAALLVAIVGVGAYSLQPSAPILGAPAALAYLDKVYTTRVGERRKVALPDGSALVLDTDTIVRVRYDGGQRWLSLDLGRATFNVAHHDHRPFMVAAGDSVIVAHGTVFDVTVGAKGVRVALIQGAIEVRKKSESKEGEQVRQLHAGEQVTFDSAQSIPASQPLPKGELSWHDGRLVFDNARLGNAVEQINRNNRRKIKLSSDGVADLRLSGGYDVDDPLSFAKTMADANGLKITELPDGTISLALMP